VDLLDVGIKSELLDRVSRSNWLAFSN